jgi:glycerol-3-phosphate acyltransferase PlsY
MEIAPVTFTVRRASMHALSGCAVVAALLTLPRVSMLAGLGALTAIALSLEIARFSRPALNNWLFALLAPPLREEERRGVSGATYFAMACLLTALAFRWDVAVAAVVFVALGDPAATVVGVWKGGLKLWGRSLLGDAACLVVCIGAGILVASFLDGLSLTAALLGATAATILQALPLPINDNVTIPVGSAAVMTLTLLAT